MRAPVPLSQAAHRRTSLKTHPLSPRAFQAKMPHGLTHQQSSNYASREPQTAHANNHSNCRPSAS
eukprot:1723113-Amphidinium_carterae.4